ncbi:DUF368 domain-containing protein [Halopseudomonas salegens]|uniref:Putative membrane protein n=1 Tax=Halopseudomonas salegens TaxID=1434072 RepID=A0A1H2FX78_9GAMM|nr:DUF368 domain-containing protein [Halopseudomonas salegens]SDU11955.1 putative membrane protein [Halopseudomonas salegens]
MKPSNRRRMAFVLLFFKGMAMGAADLVPGVSGGTVAFITGIYERLLAAIAACTPGRLLAFMRGQVRESWLAIDGTFLLVLLAGIFTSIATLARVISYLLAEQSILIWSFFFGLILISIPLVARNIERWNSWVALLLVLGAGLAWLLGVSSPLQLQATPVVVFFGAALAICAMILPGVSGSFILLLLGLYASVLGAVRDFNISLLVVFLLGCVAGLLSFSRLINYLLLHARNVTLAFLTGLLIGSLGKVWPWKQTLSWRENSAGEQVPLLQSNIWPAEFARLTGEPAQWAAGLALMLAAVVLVYLLDYWGRHQGGEQAD